MSFKWGLYAMPGLGATLMMGCAGIPADRDFQGVRQMAAAHGQALPDLVVTQREKKVSELTSEPITEATAVQMAFLLNPRLQAEYARLGLSGAEVMRMGRLSNPTLSLAVLSSSASGDVTRYDIGLTQNIAELLLLPARTRFSRGEFERAKMGMALSMIDLAAQVQSAYYAAVGARQIARMRETVSDAASGAAELSERFKDAGNLSALQLAVDRAAASQAKLDFEKARAESLRADSDLNELMGLGAEARWALRGGFAAPVGKEESLEELQNLASSGRLDLQSARRSVQLLEANLAATRTFRLLGSLDVGAQYERDSDGNRLIGPSLSLQLPIFNQGQGTVLRAQSELELARADVEAKQIEMSNSVKRSFEHLKAIRARINRLREETIPLRETIVARTQEQVNYMLVGVFDLLRVKQDEYDAYQQYLEAVRDYWQARVELARSVGTRLPSDAAIGDADIVPPVPVEPTGPPEHMHHGQHGALPTGKAPPSAPPVESTPHEHH